MKFLQAPQFVPQVPVAPPCGERGLKYNFLVYKSRVIYRRSPLRGAWIEMVYVSTAWSVVKSRSPLRGAWIEMAK